MMTVTESWTSHGPRADCPTHALTSLVAVQDEAESSNGGLWLSLQQAAHALRRLPLRRSARQPSTMM